MSPNKRNERSCRRTMKGKSIFSSPLDNKGVAFTREERRALRLEGLLPPVILTLEEQEERAYAQFLQQPSNLRKNIMLNDLAKRNTVLFYRLLMNHLAEMLPRGASPQ